MAGGYLDRPPRGSVVSRAPVQLLGWCLFPAGTVANVHVSVNSGSPRPARLGMERPDIARLTDHPSGPICGFEYILDLARLPAEIETVHVDAVAQSTDGRILHLDPVSFSLGPAPAAFVDRDGRAAQLRARSTRGLAGTRGHARAPLKLLAFSHELPYGGASLYLFEVLRRLVEPGDVECAVVSLADGPLRDEFEAIGITVHLTEGFPCSTVERYEGNIAELVAWAAPHHFDAALVNTMASFSGADVAARLGIPAVWAIHESFDLPVFWATAFLPGTLHPYVSARAEESLGRAEAIVFEAEATRRLYLPYADTDRLVTIPYGIELGEIDAARRSFGRVEARRRLGIPEDATVVLCLGTIEARKSQAILAQAFAEVAARHPRALLALVGASTADWCAPYFAGLRDYLSRSGLAPRVRVEAVTDDPYTWHQVADVLVCASDLESLPRSILEAMAFETPVLSTEVFGVPELIDDGRTGFLCAPRDVGALARGLDRVLSAPAEELRAVALAGAERVRARHRPGPYAAQMSRLLRGLVDEPCALPSELLERRPVETGAERSR